MTRKSKPTGSAKKKPASKAKTAKGSSGTRRKSARGFSLKKIFGKNFSWGRFIVASGLFCFAGGLLLLSWFCYDLPDTSQVQPLNTKPSITVLAHDGTMIARYGGLKGDLVQVRDLPPYVGNAVLAIEDRRFYSHYGVDPLGLARAMWVNVKARRFVQGGSTITQQLAKNLFLTPEKTIRRKVQEALLALIIDFRHDKDEILSAYLNRVYYGSGAYGIDAAARTYFDKPAQDLTLWEGAMLAGLLKAPSRYSPAVNPKLARDRTRVVISAMEDAGYLSEAQKSEELSRGKVELAGSGKAGDLNRYFADWIINQIDSFVSNNDRDIIVRTTFDTRLQILAEEKLAANLAKLPAEEKDIQAAIITMTPDGAVVAMIGGRDYTESQFNRATQAVRQPGSAFKPMVYLAAIETGFSPTDKIEDAPITTGKYRPKNHDGKYYGVVTLTDALALSLNTATIRLLDTVGTGRLVDVTRRLGFLQKLRAELASGLGASETTLIELTNAYAVIANGGFAIWPYAVLSIEDTAGNKLYQHTQVEAPRLFTERDMRALDSMLVQVVARGTGQAAQLSQGHVAGKTGTSQDYRDAWFVGYTDRLVTGVWLGKDNSGGMKRISGGGYPARIWHDYMQAGLGVSVPMFSPRLQRAATRGSDGFSGMLERLFGGKDDKALLPARRSDGMIDGLKGNDTRPTYNR